MTASLTDDARACLDAMGVLAPSDALVHAVELTLTTVRDSFEYIEIGARERQRLME